MTFDDEMLKAAAEELGDSLLSAAEELPQEEHTFSPEFEKKMTHLIHKKKFPWREVALATAAILALIAIVLSASLSSAVDVRAGDDEFTNSVLMGYARSGRTEECKLENMPDYELSYIPEGYTLEKVSKMEGKTVYRYGCGNQVSILFSYVGVCENTDRMSYNPYIKFVSVPFKNTRAHLYLDETRYGTSLIVWTDPDTNIQFKISFRCSREELLRLAYSVMEKEKN